MAAVVDSRRGKGKARRVGGEGKKSQTSGVGADVAQRIGPILWMSRSRRRKNNQTAGLKMEIDNCMIS
jgi:hypothetical protein